jgi:hypothetical protein
VGDLVQLPIEAITRASLRGSGSPMMGPTVHHVLRRSVSSALAPSPPGFWVCCCPPRLAREMNGVRTLIAGPVQARKTLKSATKSEFLGGRLRRSAGKRRTPPPLPSHRLRLMARPPESAARLWKAVLRCRRENQIGGVGRIDCCGGGDHGGGRSREHRQRGDSQGGGLCGIDSRGESARGEGKRSRRGRSSSGGRVH